MPNCVVIGCTATSGMAGRRFFRFPMLDSTSSQTLAITRARQQSWEVALNIPKFSSQQYKNAIVCDQHFTSGKPASYNDVNSPDWIPTLNLGYKEENEEINIEVKQEFTEVNAVEINDPSIVAKPTQVFIVMSNPESQADFSKMCRLCLSENVLLKNLYPDPSDKGKPCSNKILEIIERFTTIKINPTDKLPQKICQNCVQTLNAMMAFQNKCKQSDAELQKMKLSLEMVIDDQPNIKVEIPDDDLMIPDDKGPDIPRRDFESDDTFRHEARHDFASRNMTNEPFIYKHPSSDREKVACHICGKLYDPYQLQYHINVHNGVNPYHCDMANCNSKFAAPHKLKLHKKSCHPDNPNLFTCDVCGRGFRSTNTLKRHQTNHFDPIIPCTICGKLLRHRSALKKHMLVHSQERKFNCDVCKKAFQNRYTLRIHKRVHTQEKPYACFCGVSFAYKCLLKSHSEKYHKETNTGKTDELPPSVVSTS